MRESLQEKKVSLTPHFQKYDLEQSGEVSFQQFSSLIHRFQINFSNQDINYVLNKFRGKSISNIRWIDLCSEVDYGPIEEIPKVNPKIIEQSPVSKHISSEGAFLLAEISKVGIHNFEDEIRKADRMSRGVISPNQLKLVFVSLGIQFSSIGFDDFCLFYKVSENISYAQIFQDLNQIPKQESTKTDYEEDVRMALLRLKAFFLERKIYPGDVFSIYDTTNSKSIPSYRIPACLSNVGYSISPTDVLALTNQFKDQII